MFRGYRSAPWSRIWTKDTANESHHLAAPFQTVHDLKEHPSKLAGPNISIRSGLLTFYSIILQHIAWAAGLVVRHDALLIQFHEAISLEPEPYQSYTAPQCQAAFMGTVWSLTGLSAISDFSRGASGVFLQVFNKFPCKCSVNVSDECSGENR